MLRILYYLLFFLIPPLAVCSVIVYKSISDISFVDPEPIDIGDLQMPVHDENKLNAIILLGNKGTEISDLLIPYNLLSETGEFNVYAVANHRILSPLNGGIDILPHYTLDQINELLNDSPDLVVIPNIPNINAPDDKPVVEWIKNLNVNNTTILSICEGARTLAETGLIDYKKATTHWSAINQLRRNYPNTSWVEGVKYVEDGNIISTAGVVTGSMEGTLHVISKLIGRNKTDKLVDRLGYKTLNSMNIDQYSLELRDIVWFLTALYPWNKKSIGVHIKNGFDEIRLSAILDVYPRSFTATTQTFTDEKEIVLSKHKLFVVGKHIQESVGQTARSIDLDDNGDNEIFPFDSTIMELAQLENRAIATTVAKTLDYRIDHLRLEGKGWPFGLLIGPLALGVLGILCAYVFEKRYLSG